MPPGGAQLPDDPQRSPTSVASVSMLRRVRLRAVLNGFSTEISENFARPQIFAFRIAGDRAEVLAAWWCAACSRPLEVLNICAERRHAAACEIACGSQRISVRMFRKIFAAAKFCVRNRVRSRRHPCRLMLRSLHTTRKGPQQLSRASACYGV